MPASIERLVATMGTSVRMTQAPAQRSSWENAARVATPFAPVTARPPAAASHAALASLVLDFPEPALVFDRRCQCVYLNDRAARALGVNPDLVADLGALALGLPDAIADAILALTDPRRPTQTREREVTQARGTGVRRYRVTPHPESGEVLVTWEDLVGPQEAARQLASLHEAIRAHRELALADGRRRREALVQLGAELEATAAALCAVTEELTEEGWGLPPGRSPGDVLTEESRRLTAVLARLTQLAAESPASVTVGTGSVVEL
jgi:PAS domain-containing protein